MTAAHAPRIEWLDEVDSTNDAVRRRFIDEVTSPQYASLATTNQTSGRGRLEREWVDSPGASLAISTYLEFSADAASTSIGWVTLAAGLALRATLALLAGPEQAARLELKWPNDVLIEGRKTAGILGEILGVIAAGERFACVVGTGINLRDPQAATSSIVAASLADLGISVSPDDLARAYVAALASRIDALVAHDGDAEASGLAAELREQLSTLDRRVRVSRVDDVDLFGTATGVGATGELLVTDERGTSHSLRVGDVHHLRLDERGGQ